MPIDKCQQVLFKGLNGSPVTKALIYMDLDNLNTPGLLSFLLSSGFYNRSKIRT